MPVAFDPGPAPLASPKPRVAVFRVSQSGDLALLPNVKCLSVEVHEGAHPGSAHFRYSLDPQFSDAPTRFEAVFPITCTDPSIARPDDRLAVAAFDPDGNPRYLFDGFVSAPQGQLSREHESVTFQALGVAHREWDDILTGSYVRGADDVSGRRSDVLVDVAARFNPDGMGNAVPKSAEAIDDDDFQYPAFLDPGYIAQAAEGGESEGSYADAAGVEVGRKWTLEMAARYLMSTGNRGQGWVTLPDWQSVRDLLVAQVPRGAAYDPDDPSTYDVKQVPVRDYHPHNKAWPDALHELIHPHGFGMRFALEADAAGLPTTRLVLWRRQQGTSRRKLLYLQAPGDELDPASTNVGSMRAQRDSARVVNVVRVETAPDRWEASFVLAPGFAVAASDVANKAKFKQAGPGADYANNSDKYRLWIFDECGEGHWSPTGWQLHQGGDLTPILGDPSEDDTAWAARRRPGKYSLFSKGASSQAGNKQPLRAGLAISFDYAGEYPAVWDGSGTWRAIKGEWALAKDRLGVRVNCLDPNNFHAGAEADAGAGGTPTTRSPALRLVEWLAGTPPKPYYLRLTAVIEGDRSIDATAYRRSASPTLYDVVQVVDARDRFARERIHTSSEHNDTGLEVGARDDSKEAADEAAARQRATEAPPLAGHATIPKLVLAYEVGDRVEEIVGRDASMQTNAGTGAGVTPTFPEVVGVRWHLDGDHATELLLDDRRADLAGHR